MTENGKIRENITYAAAMLLFSFSIMAAETLFMHQLLIITNYLNATFVISIAMLGIALGSLLSFYLARIPGFIVLLVASLLYVASIPLSYYNIVRIGQYGYPYFLILPFIFAAIIVSMLFSRTDSNRIYFANLIASASGVIFPIFSVSAVKSENSLILLMYVPAIFIFILIFTFRNIVMKIISAVISISLALCVTYVLKENLKIPLTLTKAEFEERIIPSIKSKFDKDFMLSHYTLQGDKYLIAGSDYEKKRAKYVLQDIGYWPCIDINYNIKCDKNNNLEERKTWCTQMKLHNWKLVFSEDDLMGKIDLFAIDDKNIFFCTNAIPLDTVDKADGTFWDPRVPHVDNANAFIIGLSYDGIVKSVKKLTNARVSGVEFSPIIMRLMVENNKNGYYSEFGHWPYKNMDAYQAEGRYFLSSNNITYDMITLMNIHYEYPAIATLAPEYLHTVEATKMMLNKLSDKGMLVYEEIIETKRSRFGFYKFLNTIKQSLRELGIQNPENHVIIYSWDFWGKWKQFQTVIVKRAPFTQQELNTFSYYHSVIQPKYGSDIFLHPKMKTGHKFEEIFRTEPPIHYYKDLPDSLFKKELEKDILSKLATVEERQFVENLYKYNPTYSRFYLKKRQMTQADNERYETILTRINYPYELDLSPITDDKPYQFNIYVNKKEVITYLDIIMKLVGLMMIPVLILILFKYGKYKFRLLGHTLFFGLLGFGYMLIEIVLMQKYQQFIGSPIYSTIVILGGLLFSSGLGSFLSRSFGKKVLIVCMCLIPVLILFQIFCIDGIFNFFAKQSFTSKLYISAGLIFPLAFLMGIPFPHALEQVKEDISNEYATLMFGVNGAMSTVAATLSMLLNVTHGMNLTLMTGFSAYAAAILLFVVIKR